MKTNLLTFKEKDRYIKSIYQIYNQSVLKLKMMDDSYNYYPSGILKIKDTPAVYDYDRYYLQIIERRHSLETYIHMIDHIHKLLTSESYLIIKQEYLHPGDKRWWSKRYSHATYYRYKNKAFDEFFSYFDESSLPK